MPTSTPRPSYFPDIPAVSYEGPATDNPFAFRWYDENRVVAGKTMKEHMRFACAYWHSFNGNGSDPFGGATHVFPWDASADPIRRAYEKMDAAFEFITKMGIPYYCFHDVDVVDYTDDIAENERRLQTIVDYAKQKQADTGVKLLWGTANLFSHARYMNGAATNPDFHVLAHAGAQVKAALDATIELGGENYVFWGGREGYMSLLNTNMKREKEHLARFLHTAKDYARRNGFKGTFFIEPKPGEPSKHQYDFDVETVVGFLRQYDLLEDFKINIEVNHATSPATPSPTNCRRLQMQAFWDPLTPTAVITRTAGTPTNSRIISMSLPRPCWSSWKQADSAGRYQLRRKDPP
jgi:xylose isomerase